MRCSMPRRARIAPGEIIYHALNRANGRSHEEKGTFYISEKAQVLDLALSRGLPDSASQND